MMPFDDALYALNAVDFPIPEDPLFGVEKYWFSDSRRALQTAHLDSRCQSATYCYNHMIRFCCKQRHSTKHRKAILEGVSEYQARVVQAITAPRPAA